MGCDTPDLDIESGVEFIDGAVVGGYENPDQSLPEGEGLFRFESFDVNIANFESTSFEEVLRYIWRNLKPFRIVRMKGGRWSVESDTEQYGELTAFGEYLDGIGNCGSNGDATAPPINTASDRDEEDFS